MILKLTVGFLLLFQVLMSFMLCFFTVLTKGQSVSKYYRFLVRTGGWVWLQTKANIVYDSKSCQPQFVLCTNYIISYVLPTFVYNLTCFLKTLYVTSTA